MAVDLDVVVDMDPGLLPIGIRRRAGPGAAGAPVYPGFRTGNAGSRAVSGKRGH